MSDTKRAEHKLVSRAQEPEIRCSCGWSVPRYLPFAWSEARAHLEPSRNDEPDCDPFA